MKRWHVLLGIWVVAFLLRGAYLWQIADAPFIDLRIGDALSYHAWARRLADGDWVGRDVFYQAPLYPYFLAVIYKLFGDSVTVVRVVQAGIGATSCVCLAAAGMSLFGMRGAVAGLALAVYPSAIFFDGLLEKSSLVTFFTTALLALLAWSSRAGLGRWIAVGVVLGLLALTRENALLLALPVLVWIVLQAPARSRVVAPLAFVAGALLVLMPVALRNFTVAGEFHLTTSQFGPNFYIGNHPGASGFYEPLVIGHGSAADERDDAVRLAEQGSGRRLTPGEVSQYWTTRAVTYIRSQPRAWLKLMARKAALTFNANDVADTESRDVFADWSSLLRVLRPFDFGIVLAVAVFGAVLTAREWRRLWFLYAIAATYGFSVVLFYVFERYRFPIVPVLMLLAAGGIAALSRRADRGRLVTAGAIAVVALAAAHLSLAADRGARVIHYHGIAATLAKDPARVSDAMAFYARALEVSPQFPAAQLGLATLLTRSGRAAAAVPYFRTAVQSWPDDPEARYNFGVALAETGDVQEASRQFEEALRIQPDDPDAHLALGKALLSMERPSLAAPHFQRSVELRPKNVSAHVGLGVALSQLHRFDQAIEQYRAAIALDPNNAAAENSLGWTLATQGRIEEAVPHFERALELNPADENARRNLDRVRELQRSGGINPK